ncbi:MAG: glycosyltransferase [Nitrosopumilus sp.]
MKIALVSEFPPFHSGFAQYAQYLVGALRGLGNEVSVITTARNGESYDDVFRSIDAMYNLDVIHLNYGYDSYPISDRFISFLKELRVKAKLVVTMHTINNMRRGTDTVWFNLALANTVDSLIVHSEPMKEELLRQGVSSEKIIIIPHGTRILFLGKEDGDRQAIRTKLGVPPEMKMVLALGFLEPDKGFEELIDAVAGVRNAFLVIAGEQVVEEDSHLVDKLQASADRQLTGRFKLVSHYLTETEILQLLSAADVLAFAYRPSSPDDTFYSVSGVLHLAFGSGKSIVASENPKFVELMKVMPQVVVPAMDIHSLKNIIHRVISDKPFQELVVEKIANYAIETSWDKVAQLYVQAYRSEMPTRTPEPKIGNLSDIGPVVHEHVETKN